MADWRKALILLGIKWRKGGGRMAENWVIIFIGMFSATFPPVIRQGKGLNHAVFRQSAESATQTK